MAREIELLAARAGAPLTSDLSARCCHSEAGIAAAIMRALRSHSAVGGCAGEVAAVYGEHPETAGTPDTLGSGSRRAYLFVGGDRSGCGF